MNGVLLAGAAFVGLFQSFAKADTNSYSLFFQPGVTITSFQSTLVVPPLSAGSGTHAVWPGLENDALTLVYQNVVNDSPAAGQYVIWIEECCTPNTDSDYVLVYPGDKIHNVFSLDTSSGVWTDTWTLTPGSTGISKGETDQSFSQTNTFSGDGVLDWALLAIEVEDGGTWDFGQVQFENVIITAETTSTSWCTTPEASSTEGSFSFSASTPSSSVSGSSTTCTYGSVIFEQPN